MTHSSRKRSRLCDDDRCEFMPISKRINKLHIRSGQFNSDDEGGQEGLFDQQQQQHSNGNCDDVNCVPSHSNGFNLHHNGHSEASCTTNGVGIGGGPSRVGGVGPNHVNHHQPHSINNNPHLCNNHAVIYENGSSSSCSSSSAASSSDANNLECQLQVLQQRAEEVFRSQQYSPDLTEAENPYYHQVNEMLYQLHVLRTQRMNRNHHQCVGGPSSHPT